MNTEQTLTGQAQEKLYYLYQLGFAIKITTGFVDDFVELSADQYGQICFTSILIENAPLYQIPVAAVQVFAPVQDWSALDFRQAAELVT